MLKCKGCKRFIWSSYCYADGETRQDCPSHGDETKCELYPERRKNAQERLEAEMSRRFIAKWFDFDKQKPVHGDCVLGIDTEGNIEVYQYSDEWSSCLMKYDGNIKVFNITHWMPLPQTPVAYNLSPTADKSSPVINADRCVCCGAIIPEGQMVCPNCLVTIKEVDKQ